MACRRRGAARGAPLRPRRCCGGCLRPGPPRWAPSPVLGPTAGPPPGVQKGGAHGRPPSGVRYRPPAPRAACGVGPWRGGRVAWCRPPAAPWAACGTAGFSAGRWGLGLVCAAACAAPRPAPPPAALPPRCCGSPPRRPSPSFPSAWRSAALRRAGLRFACPAGGSAACGRRLGALPPVPRCHPWRRGSRVKPGGKPPLTLPRQGRQTESNGCRRRRVPPTARPRKKKRKVRQYDKERKSLHRK